MHITFLFSKPVQFDIEVLRQKQSLGKEFTVAEKAAYLYCPNGYGKTKLANSFFENKLKVIATTRNWKTSNELLKIAEAKNN